MPELPDIEDYLAALRPRMVGRALVGVRIRGFSLLKTFDPPLEALHGQVVTSMSRLGKRIVWHFEDVEGEDEPLHLVLHLMIAGRLRWKDTAGAPIPGKVGMAAFDLDDATLVLTEAGTKKRASLHVERGAEGLSRHDRGGIEPLEADLVAFSQALTRENRTLKRGLTDPRVFHGIGNAFSDEILHAAGLSPVKRTQQLDDDELSRLHRATRQVLGDWVARLREETGDGFPTDVTAFRPGFAVHGRHGEPCPVCDTPVQRIRYASNETNYCPRCQTGGKLLADRSLSRLLKDDWPRTVDELEGA
jgi:formamidopyrimidine-DNA glycosylase